MVNFESVKIVYLFLLFLMAVLAFRSPSFLSKYVFDKSNQRRDEYECGYRPFDCHMRQSFSVQFYLVGIVFVLFDVEIAILFPWAYSFWNLSKTSFFLGTFIILFVVIGIFYEGITKAIVWENFAASKVKKNDWISEIINAIIDSLYAIDAEVDALCESIDFACLLESLVAAPRLKEVIDIMIIGPLDCIFNEPQKHAGKKPLNFSEFFDNPINYNFFVNALFFLARDMYSFGSQDTYDVLGTKLPLPFDALYSAAIIFAADLGFDKAFLNNPLYWNSWKPTLIELATHFAIRAISHSHFNFTLETDTSEIGFESCYLNYLLYISQSLYTLGDSYIQEKTVSTIEVIDANLFLQKQKNISTPFWLEKFYEFFCIFYKYILQELNNSFSCEPFDDEILIDLKKNFDKKLKILIVTKILPFYIMFLYYFWRAFGSDKT